MKKIFITSIVALALVIGSAGSAQAVPGYTFSNYLTVGSTGADVTALQSWLISSGFDIPAISSGVAVKGYFGQQTKAAVVKYQASVGLPNTGFVGPLTVAKLNGTTGMAIAIGCPIGYDCVAKPGTVPPIVCPVGYDCVAKPGTVVASVVVATSTVWVADGMDGSVTLSTNSYVATSQTLKKGDMDKPILAITAKATAGSVNINRFDIHFSARPWLLFGKLVLKDVVSGQVLATKILSSSADATEVTVASDYLVRFENVNAIVTPAKDTTFVVTANVLSDSDKITGQTVTISSDANGIRTINGKGYTDSTGIIVTNTVILSSTGNIGDLLTAISPSTPNTRTDNVSTTSVTPDTILGVFDVKLQNQAGTLSTMNFQVNTSMSNNVSASTLLATNNFQNFRLYQGSTLLAGAYSVSSTNPAVIVFTNLSISVGTDAWKSLTLKADVLATSTAFSASSTLVKSSIVGTDANYNTVTLTNAGNRTSNNVTFVPNAGIVIKDIVITKGSVTTPTTGVWLSAYPSITFTIQNTGNNPIYISQTSNSALATTTSSGPVASSTVSSVSAGAALAGDVTSTAYIINNGSSRTFTYNYFIDNKNGEGTGKKISLTQINYGTGSAAGTGAGQNAELNVNYGLENAYIQVP